MAFDTLKVAAGQQIAQIIDVELDQCKYTTRVYVNDGKISITSSLAQGFTGQVAIIGGVATSFTDADPYMQIEDEIVKITVLSLSIVEITARGAFGTTDVQHDAGAATLLHSGQADGSCYSFPQTCSSPDSFQADTFQTFRFSSVPLDWAESSYSGFNGWTHNPPEINPGDSLGRMASISFSLKDGVDGDLYVPYSDRRTTNGTLFTKMLARNQFMEGRPCKVHMGFDPKNLDFDNFITREYIMNSVQLRDGLLSVSARDPLMLADEVKSKAPVLSSGNLVLLINDASTQIQFKDAAAFYYGQTGETVFVRIDSEVIETTVSATSDILTIDNRAIGGTEQKDHSVNATVQECLVYTQKNVVEIIEELLTDYTNIPSRFLDDYSAAIAATSTILLTANINKPTSVRTLINELIKTGDLIVYFDEQNQLIRIKLVNDPEIENLNLTQEDHILRDSITFTREPGKQYTRFPVAWAPNDITKTTGDEENFSIIQTSIEANNESAFRKGEINEQKMFFNRWLTSSPDDVILGTSISQRLLDRNANMPETINFKLDVESVYATQGATLDYGTIVNIATDRRVEVDGSPKARNYQITRMKDDRNMQYSITAKLFQEPSATGEVDFTISTSAEDFDLSTVYAPTAGNYTVLIDEGVVIGSTVVGTPAFTTGSQNPGVTFDFIIRGKIYGAGGAGGAGDDLLVVNTGSYPKSERADGETGFDGGDAFDATVDCTINTGSGLIWAGGGGGAGFESFATAADFNTRWQDARGGNGGGGGQGYVGGLGGAAGRVYEVSMGGGDQVFDTGVTGSAGSLGSNGWTGGAENTIGGGTFGLDGDADPNGAFGGLAGYAIVSNGNTVTIISGDNSNNIKGRRS